MGLVIDRFTRFKAHVVEACGEDSIMTAELARMERNALTLDAILTAPVRVDSDIAELCNAFMLHLDRIEASFGIADRPLIVVAH